MRELNWGRSLVKKNIHPTNYREVAFRDTASGHVFIIKSTVNTNETINHEGRDYPLLTVDTSSQSHAFYTGNRQSARSTGRVERFNRMFHKKRA